MTRQANGKKASEILLRRYVGDDGDRRASLEVERVNAEVARMIYELRDEAGLTQKQLAELVGTKQSVISRLESSDYEGHSLSMLARIAKALNRHLAVGMPKAAGDGVSQYAFCELMRLLRVKAGLSIQEFARKLDLDTEEVRSMEHDPTYRPNPRALFRVSAAFEIPQRKLAILAGAVKKESPSSGRVVREASRFAAQSESFASMSRQQKKTLDAFVCFLRTEE